MGIKEREWSDSTFSYRFSFNGKEDDSEVSGQGNTIVFEARIYDSRLGRFFSTDPRQGEKVIRICHPTNTEKGIEQWRTLLSYAFSVSSLPSSAVVFSF
mgnify:CR=1 FL=1